VNIIKENLPQHIAIIPDGNGRWAKKRTIGRIRGHKKGVNSVKTVVRTCREIGIKYLTLFAFSTENWGRPEEEINALMFLLEEYLEKEISELHKQKIKLRIIGDLDYLQPAIKEKLIEAQKLTVNNDQMTFNMALNYSGRDEIIYAIKKMMQDGKNKIEDINKETFAKYLQTYGMPDPDLLIRTSGEYRISNYLLWQLAYTELYFTDVLWPDFKKDDLLQAIASYQNRERRFGLTSEQLNKDNGKSSSKNQD